MMFGIDKDIIVVISVAITVIVLIVLAINVQGGREQEHASLCKAQNMDVVIWGQRVNKSATYHYFCVDNRGRVFISGEVK